jgi:hypothetical protein
MGWRLDRFAKLVVSSPRNDAGGWSGECGRPGRHAHLLVDWPCQWSQSKVGCLVLTDLVVLADLVTRVRSAGRSSQGKEGCLVRLMGLVKRVRSAGQSIGRGAVHW